MTDIATYSHLQNQSPQNKEDSTHIDNDETLITKNEEVNNPNVHVTQSALITYNDNNNTPQTVCINNTTTTTNNNKPRQLFISSQVNLNKDDDINNKPTLSYAKTNQLLKEPFFVVKKSTSTNKTNVVDGNGCCVNKRNETKKCSVSCVNKKFNHFYIKSSCDDDADKDNNNSYNVGMYHRNDMFNFGVDVCKMNNDITMRNINYPITESNYNYSTYNNAIFNNKEISYNYLMNTNTNTSNTKYNNDNISMNNDKMMLNTTAITDNANNNIDNNNTKTENTSQMNNNNNTVATTTRNAISSSFKECYIDLLITSATQLINNGLDVSALSNKKQTPSLCYSSDNDNNNNTNEPHKCDNKLCPVIFNKHNTSNIATMKSLNNKTIYLCINCFQAFQKEQYCYYCGIIYREYRGKKGFNDNKTWIGCDYCSNWEHVKCEETKGLFKNLSILIRDKQFKYRCPFCREKEKDIKQSLSSTTTSKAKHVTFNYINQKRKTINNSKASCLVGNGNGIKKKKQCNNDLYNDIQTILALDKNVQYLYNEKVD